MIESGIKFNLIDNKNFHDKLETLSTSVLHHKTMENLYQLLDEPVDASSSVFVNLKTEPNGKCYYPFFLREPFSLKNVDFCNLIDPEHLQQLKDREIIPLVCMLSESWKLFNLEPNRIFRNSPYFNIINQLEKHNIREEDVVWLTCNKYHVQDIRIKSTFIHFDFFLEQQKVLGNEFLPLTEIKHKYISMARGVPRHHRFAMTYLLHKNNLLQHGAISCADYENFSYQGRTETTDDYIKKIENFNLASFHDFKSMLPLIINNMTTEIVVPDHESYQSPINLHQDGRDESHLFRNVFLNVVNETHHPDDIVFITEKTYRSINYCRPFVINGDSGSLQYLKDMGFKTFEKFWDESYDADDDHTKITKICKIVEYVCGLDTHELLTLYEAMRPILIHNYNLLKQYEQWNKLN
jgi:hypothetical protein